MSRYKYQGTMKDGNGRVIGSATTSDGQPGVISIFLAGTSTSANAYTASAGGSAAGSVSTDEHGYFYFWVDANDYASTQEFKISCAHSDFRTQEYDDLIIFPSTSAAGDGLDNVVEDLTPQLGGDLDMNGHKIGGNSETDLDDAIIKKHDVSDSVSDAAYGVAWNGVTTISPSKNAVYDKIETLGSGGLDNIVEDLTPQLGSNLDMNGFSIGGNTEVQLDDAVSKKHTQNADTALGAQTENLDMNTHKIVDVVDPTSDQDAATKKYFDDNANAAHDLVGAKHTVSSLTPGHVLQAITATTFGFGAIAGGGDVSGPATNTDDYVPLWDGADSKLLKNGFAITAAGKALIDDADAAAQRTTLGLGSVATRTVRDTLMVDDETVPDGEAVIAYGDANWGAGSSKWTDGGTYIYGTAETGNTRLHDSGQLEIGATGGTSAPLISADKWGFSSDVTEDGRRLLVLDGTEDHTLTPATWIEKLYDSNSDPGGDNSIPVCLYAAHKHSGSGVGYTHTIMAYALNSGTGNNDVIAVSGRARKKGAGVGDSCGVWGSAYNDVNQDGGIMAVEAAVYQNAAGMVAGDRLMSKWSAGLHVSGISTGSPAKAGIAIDAANTYRFWNAMIIDKNCFVGAGPAGTVGINMGSCDINNYPQYAIKLGKADTHIYCNYGDLKFYDPVTGAKTLAELAAAGGGGGLWTDETTYYRPDNVTDSGNTGFRIYDAGYSQLGQIAPTTGSICGGGSTDGTVLKINHGNSGAPTNDANSPLWVKRYYNYAGSTWNAGAAYFGCVKTANSGSLHTVQIDTQCQGGSVPVSGGVLSCLLSHLTNDSCTSSGEDIHNMQIITYTPSSNYSSVHAAVVVDVNNRYGSKGWLDDYAAGWTNGVRVANESTSAYDNSCAYSMGAAAAGGKWYIGYEVNDIAYDAGTGKGEGIYFRTSTFDTNAACMRADGKLTARAGADIELYYGTSNWIHFKTGTLASSTTRAWLTNGGNFTVTGTITAQGGLGANLAINGKSLTGTGTIELPGAKIKSDALLLNARSSTPTTSWTNGLIYYDTSLNQLRVYKSGAWKNVTTS